MTQFQGIEYGRKDRISVSEFIYKEEMTSLDSGLSLIFAACSLACFDEASCHIGSCLWRDSSGKQLRVASSQQPRRNLILPTAMWLNLETAHSPAERLEMPATQTSALATMCEWARSQRTQFSCTWTPELQTRWENTGWSQSLVLLHTAMHNEHNGKISCNDLNLKLIIQCWRNALSLCVPGHIGNVRIITPVSWVTVRVN